MIDEEGVIINRALELVSRGLYQDLKEFYESNEVMKIFRVLTYMALSDEINRDKISKELGISKDKFERIADSLVRAEMLIKFPVYKR